jgi:bifunctional DNA-binding transcriptional regulator/antitoxin component of YhaV-PrlF toxin-antitoxin module
MTMFAFAKITAKGQTTIPQNARAALHVAPSDLIAWEVGADGMAIIPGSSLGQALSRMSASRPV